MKTQRFTWNQISKDFHEINPELAEKIDVLNPSDSHAIYELSFNYGDMIGDNISQFIPIQEGENNYRLTSEDLPNHIKKELGYGKNSSPLGMIMTKGIEFFVDDYELGLTRPKSIARPGTLYNVSSIMTSNTNRKKTIIAPNGLLKATAGARSTFCLSKISEDISFKRLQNIVGSFSDKPKVMYDHFNFFRELTSLRKNQYNWNMKLIYFSEKFVNSILNDKKWGHVKSHIFQTAWESTEFTRSQYYFDVSFSQMKKTTNSEKNSFLNDTARHLFDMSLSIYPGFSVATDNELIPLTLIQDSLIDFYGMNKYIPHIMVPTYLSNKIKNIYYSLQYPGMKLYSPVSNVKSTKFSLLDDIEKMTNKIQQQIIAKESIWEGTLLQETAKNLSFSFIHPKQSNSKGIIPPSEAIKNDSLFSLKGHINNLTEYQKPNSDSLFFNGCVCLKLDN